MLRDFNGAWPYRILFDHHHTISSDHQKVTIYSRTPIENAPSKHISLLLNKQFVPCGNALLATKILLILVGDASVVSSRCFAVAVFAVKMGVIVVIAVDIFDVFGAPATSPDDNFGFFLIVLPNFRFS